MKKLYLKAISGLFEGQKYTFSNPMTIGRNPGNSIHIAEKLVSRNHARIVHEDGKFIIRDENSANGTFVNGNKIEDCTLKDKDRIKIGNTEFEIIVQSPSESTKQGKGAKKASLTNGDEQFKVGETIEAESENPLSFLFPQVSTSDQKRLNILIQACTEIQSELDIEQLANQILSYAFQLIPAHRGVVLLKDEETENLKPFSIRTRTNIQNKESIKISSTIVNKVISERTGLVMNDISSDGRIKPGESILAQDIRSAMCAPIIYNKKILGVVYVDSTGRTEPFPKEDLAMLSAIVGPAAVAFTNARYIQALKEYAQTIERARIQTLSVVANAIEGRDHYTVGHVWRVTKFAEALAEEVGWDEEMMEKLRLGGPLHDIGKIAVEDSILRKNDPLSDKEYEQMKIHPEKGVRMLKNCKALEPAIPFVLYHHERFDGAGYPFGLSRTDIPVEGRLLAVPDAFDALTSNRPYREGLDPDIAIKEIKKQRGTQFDPRFSDAFVKIYRKGKVNSILQEYYKGKDSVCCPYCSTFTKVNSSQREKDTIVCPVCHQKIKVYKIRTGWIGELE